MSALYPIILAIAVQRLAELLYAARNTRLLRAQGGVEIDAGGYKLFVILHAGWLASLALFVPPQALPSWPLIAVYAAFQPLRIWVMATLGRHWTTRVIGVPDAPPVRAGPYRWLRHPNYLVVCVEIALLPLAFGAVLIAAIFSAVNLALIARRIRIENRLLAARV